MEKDLTKFVKMVSLSMGNLPIESIENCTGINDGRFKSGILASIIKQAREITKEVNQKDNG